ncbi:hypothetical protein CUJ84_pRLN1000945 (plasmid) [Rhizobium leguminosarum]|uniref:Uncharacterized protein n=1 Tax=Rhizobium leguminosarum TaxID=384 RepID=A0A2K9ZDU1_RHILE|nr:hypothetical protein CUJ84_pRLN1000945 [Rhizobium leguminosarum]
MADARARCRKCERFSDNIVIRTKIYAHRIKFDVLPFKSGRLPPKKARVPLQDHILALNFCFRSKSKI